MEKIFLINAHHVIGEYNTLREASEDTLIEVSNIELALRDRLKTSAGYFIKTVTVHKAKPVMQISLDSGTIIDVFSSIYEAKKKTGIMNITNCAKGKAKSAGGYYWKFINVYSNEAR